MNALLALCNAGGTIRISVFRNYYVDDNVEYLATVIITCTLYDKSELVPVNIFSIKGVLKKHSNTDKLFLDLQNSKDPELPNFWFGPGFSDYINVYTIKKIVDNIPVGKDRRCIEFRVLEDRTIQNVNIKNAFIQKRKLIAENIGKLINENIINTDILDKDQIDIDSIINIKETDSIFVTS